MVNNNPLKTKTMKKSICTVVREHQNVLNTRERLENIFKSIAPCHVTVGGSYMLKYWCEAFESREVSDYDFILRAAPEDIEKIGKFISLMNYQTGWFGESKYYDYKSIYFGLCNGKKANVILKPGKYCPCNNFESIEDIIKVKKAWCEKAIKNGRKPRFKDVYDITVYENWEAENGLPF